MYNDSSTKDMTVSRIAVAGRKGGVGKTTIACGIASILASMQQRVLVIDMDPQSNAAYVLGVDPTKPGTASLLVGDHLEPLKVGDYLWVLPGGPELMNHNIQSCDQEELADAVFGMDYDVVVFDCPPGNEHLERLAIKAADTVLIVSDAHPLALVGASRVIKELKLNSQKGRKGASRWAIIQSKIDARRAMDRTFDSDLAESFPNLQRFVVRQDTQLSLAAADQIPLMTYDAKCRGAQDLIVVAQWGLNGSA
ncbi:ParA family protein [Acaryochloris marina]|nr:ParA family protein [Acaryochloris marina]